MKSKDAEKSIRRLALSIGDFIRYWGFRRIHGSIWTQLYLSPRPLSCTELARRLKFSKALVSPALGELEKYKLIRKVDSTDDKTILYEAEPDTNSVIKHVLATREARLLDKIAGNFQAARNRKDTIDLIRPERLEQLETMISSAQLMLQLMLNEKEFLALPEKFEL